MRDIKRALSSRPFSGEWVIPRPVSNLTGRAGAEVRHCLEVPIAAIDVAVAAGPQASEMSVYLDQALDTAAVLKNVRHGPTFKEEAAAEAVALLQELFLE